MLTARQRHALAMFTGDSPLFDIAREITRTAADLGQDAGIIGGVAVFLHGYERTTTDVDAYTPDRKALAEALMQRGFVWDESNRELVKYDTPIHLMTGEELEYTPQYFEEREGVRVVSLAELLTLKLKTGVHEIHRAKDLADIVELIRARRVTGSYSSPIAPEVRPEFRRIMEALKGKLR